MTLRPARIRRASKLSLDVQVLILTSELDFATDRICRKLLTDGIAFLRLNRETLSEVSLTLLPTQGMLLCRKDGHEWRVGEKLRSVWWRQGTFDRNVANGYTSVNEQMERSQWSAFMRSIMVADSATWVNDPSAVYRAETKAVQLNQAARIGFDVPETLMTNDRFADVEERIGPQVALKSIDTLLLRQGDDQLFGYTTLTDWRAVATKHLHLAPATIQAPLLNKLDLRVTVMGENHWCVAIRRHGEGIDGDWRLTSKSDIEIEDYTLPADVSQKCLQLVRSLGLRYGAIDLALSNGRYWFIEVNPTGEWGWLDSDERPMTSAIAGYLSCPC